MSKLLGKSDFESISTYLEKFEIPEMKGHVYLRKLSAQDIETLNKYAGDSETGSRPIYVYVACALASSDGTPIFDDIEDAVNIIIPKIPIDTALDLHQKIIQMNGLQKKAIEDAEGNSEASPND